MLICAFWGLFIEELPACVVYLQKNRPNLVSNSSLDNSMQITLHIVFTRENNMQH
jgi:hypothetical protein